MRFSTGAATNHRHCRQLIMKKSTISSIVDIYHRVFFPVEWIVSLHYDLCRVSLVHNRVSAEQTGTQTRRRPTQRLSAQVFQLWNRTWGSWWKQSLESDAPRHQILASLLASRLRHHWGSMAETSRYLLIDLIPISRVTNQLIGQCFNSINPD